MARPAARPDAQQHLDRKRQPAGHAQHRCGQYQPTTCSSKPLAGGNIAIGPVLLGAANRPVHILTASTTVRRIVNMTALTVADANAQR
jgi:hypothetical protein